MLPSLRVPGPLLLAAAHLRGRVLDARGRRIAQLQTRTLLQHVRRARDTAFGRAHGFAEIRTLEQYRAHVPLRAYAALALGSSARAAANRT